MDGKMETDLLSKEITKGLIDEGGKYTSIGENSKDVASVRWINYRWVVGIRDNAQFGSYVFWAAALS